eukprot:3060981-Rhodomonas_salina.1
MSGTETTCVVFPDMGLGLGRGRVDGGGVGAGEAAAGSSGGGAAGGGARGLRLEDARRVVTLHHHVLMVRCAVIHDDDGSLPGWAVMRSS